MSNHPVQWKKFVDNELGMSADDIQRSFVEHIEYTQGKDEYSVTRLDLYQALAWSTRDRLLDRWNKTQQRYYRQDNKRVYYLSLEFLLGKLLRDTLNSLGILEEAREALAGLDIDLEDLFEVEWDAGLGNGGLGRLAACFLDSMASLGMAAMGYGIRYEYGIFRQTIQDGEQVETPDPWLRYGNPWEIPRPQSIYPVRFGGRVETRREGEGKVRFHWVDSHTVMAMAYDLLIPGYRNDVVNTLRLWSAKASREFDLPDFNRGDYVQAVFEKNATEDISRVLYPSDNTQQGRELRLKQEYFFVSASLQDAIRRHLAIHPDLDNLPEKAVFQLNDTHPSLAVPELMRLLMDEHAYTWERAWSITTHCVAYTNHTVMPEALEHWSVTLLGQLLPRHLQIIYEINARFLRMVRMRHPGDQERVESLSIIQEWPEKAVRMANLAIVGSFSVNGVSELHTELLRRRIFRPFAQLTPRKFNAKTNGITPRRWLHTCNPSLAALITQHISEGWVRDLRQLRALTLVAENDGFQAAWRQARQKNKLRLARWITEVCGIVVNPDSLFDVQVKRMHQYKRQDMNILHVFTLYRRLLRQGPDGMVPRTFIFAGKAAPAYTTAKTIIRLIHAVAERVNNDPVAADWLKVVFIPNYSVSAAEVIIPAADLSEQISTAGTEASGTGNMKLALNGALTIGTMDGANIEILQAVGRENLFIFGLDESGVGALRAQGYDPRRPYEADEELHDAIDLIASGALAPAQPNRFEELTRLLLQYDPFLVLRDFASYREVQQEVTRRWADCRGWTRSSILTTARMGRFSSDETIQRYAEEIWRV